MNIEHPFLTGGAARDVLPDSRLGKGESTLGDVVVDWECYAEDGMTLQTIRLALQPIYCFNCGVPAGYVPRDVMSFVSWLCQPCSEKWGTNASIHQHSDGDFWAKVSEEMQARFGRSLTQQEIWELAEQDKLGEPLKKLSRESPYRKIARTL